MAYEFRNVVYALSTTPLGIEVLFEFLSNNWNKILQELSFGTSVVDHVYYMLADVAANDDELTKVSASWRYVSVINTFLREKQSFFYFFIELMFHLL